MRDVGLSFINHAGRGDRQDQSRRDGRLSEPTINGRRRSIWACLCLIPEAYVPDLDVRLGLYRRLVGPEHQG